MLQEQEHFAKFLHSNYGAVVTRFKIMGKLDIAERRLPQDGAINFKIENKVFTCLDDCINNNFNHESIRSCLVSKAKNKNRVENNNSEDLIPIVFGTIGHSVRRNANDKSFEKIN